MVTYTALYNRKECYSCQGVLKFDYKHEPMVSYSETYRKASCKACGKVAYYLSDKK